MAAYIIGDVEITDPSRYETYKRLVPASIAAYGGRFVVRGGATEGLEGSWSPRRIVVLEFPDTARARAWWESTEYAEAKALRQLCAKTRLNLVEGA